ncbi:MAG: hypothetical protein F6K55_21360 [Moorea sp. SIO4A3]|nr:hypothetical protein [Moorena sp. SIO4A3]NEQ86805.1 hypothetical protein [Moorena sp. SIO2I5]
MTYSHTDLSVQCGLLAKSTYRLGYKAVGHATRTASFINDTGCPDPRLTIQLVLYF